MFLTTLLINLSGEEHRHHEKHPSTLAQTFGTYVEWPVSLIADGSLIFLKGFCGYVLVNIHTLSPSIL